MLWNNVTRGNPYMIAAALELARQNAPHRPVVITVDSTNALRNLTDARPTRPTSAEDAGGTAAHGGAPTCGPAAPGDLA